MTDWDYWKKYNNHVERNIYRNEAETDQIKLETTSNGQVKILVRDQFVASMPEGYEVHLRLGDHRPMVTIKTADGAVVFIAALKEIKQ